VKAPRIYENVTELIGNTPLVRLRAMSPPGASIMGKMESLNPSYSVKDRIALSMISEAEQAGKINEKTVIVEATSGNTGIGLALVCAQRGYRLILAMPESMTAERRKLLARLGAEISLTPPEQGMRGAVDRAREIAAEHGNAFIPQQFQNAANPTIHYRTTGPEIWRDTEGRCDVFVAGVGTGGTLSGAGRFLKEQNPDIRVVAVEPAESPVLSGGAAGPHRIQGIGAGFVPETLDRSVIDEVITVTGDEAFAVSARLAEEEGILAGISAGANVAASLKVASSGHGAETSSGSDLAVVTIICDTGERYLSVW